MTAATAPQQRISPAPALLALVLLAVLVGLAGRVLLTSHATERHGSEAVQIRQCIQRNGPMETWARKDNPNVQYWLCGLPDGRWCHMIVESFPSRNQGVDWRERTSFCAKQGRYQQAIRYLQKWAVRLR